MNIADQQDISIFSAALECRSPAEQSAYLDDACRHEPARRSRVEALLRAHDAAGSFLEAKFEEARTSTPVDAATVTDVPTANETPAVVAGRYRLLEVIGEGGMGTVWLAEQTEPVRRRVALKLIKPGMDSREVVGRFEAERQTLALMDHPNIAKVHDGGIADQGRPFFVMELVRGVPVTEYCDRAQLGVRERLALFIQICQALQHAHQKGIIHRDLKPSNILVTEPEPGGAGVVKVIDFGVAKAVGPSLTDNPVHTRFMQMIGTPLYMSPEQAELRGLDVDTRADIYSLGVLLYELLTGTTPFNKERFKHVGYDEVRRIIQEEEPPKPSTRLNTLGATATTLSADRGTEWRRLSRVCRGELDWMVMKSLQKDRNRRYETASAFAADVQRYLNDEPVAAGPPSAAYKMRKFVHRHRGRVAAAGVFMALMMLLVAGLTVGLVAVNAEKRRKEEALVRLSEQQEETKGALAAQTRSREQTYSALRALSDRFVVNALARQPRLGEGDKAYLRKVVGLFETLAREYGDTPQAWRIKGDGHWLVARIRMVLGDVKEAELAYRECLAVRMRLLDMSPNDPRVRWAVGECHLGLGEQISTAGRPGEAENSFREGIAILTRLAADVPDYPEARSLLAHGHGAIGALLQKTGRLPEAEAAFRAALALGEKPEAGASPDQRNSLARIHENLAIVLEQTNRVREAEAAHREALAQRQTLAADFPEESHFQSEVAASHCHIAAILAETRRAPEAETAFRESIACVRTLAADFPLVPSYREQLAGAQENLATLLTQTGRARDAEEIQRDVLAIRRKLVTEHPNVPRYRRELATSHFNLGNVLESTERAKEAETSFREAIDLQAKLVANPLHAPALRHELARSHNNLGNLLDATGRPKSAEAAYRAALELQTKLVADLPTVADYAVGLAGTCCNLGSVCQFHGRVDEAPEWYSRAIATLEPVLAKEPRLVKARLFLRNAHWGRADTLGKLKRHNVALPDWDRALELSPPGQQPAVQMGRAIALVRAGEPARATQAIDELLAAEKRPPGTLYNAACVFALAAAAIRDDDSLSQRHAARAVELLGQARAQGFFRSPKQVEHLTKDDDLAALRERDDFRKLLAELDRTPPPKDMPKNR